MTARFPENAELARPTLNRTRRSTIEFRTPTGRSTVPHTHMHHRCRTLRNALGSMMPHISERIGERIGPVPGRVGGTDRVSDMRVYTTGMSSTPSE